MDTGIYYTVGLIQVSPNIVSSSPRLLMYSILWDMQLLKLIILSSVAFMQHSTSDNELKKKKLLRAGGPMNRQA